jgi:hypothetical protein
MFMFKFFHVKKPFVWFVHCALSILYILCDVRLHGILRWRRIAKKSRPKFCVRTCGLVEAVSAKLRECCSGLRSHDITTVYCQVLWRGFCGRSSLPDDSEMNLKEM